MNTLETKNIVIVGGGTSGWLVALAIAASRTDVNCTVIDSSRLGTIGVGEGVTGWFISFLKHLGLPHDEIIAETGSLPKYGVNLINWTKKSGNFFHPLEGSISDQSGIDFALFSAILNDVDICDTSRSLTMIKNNKTDYYIGANGALSNLYGDSALHLETFKTIDYLKRKSIERGCKHVDSEIQEINLDERGYIKSVNLADHRTVAGDIFIDCTGFSRVLMSKLEHKWISYKKILPVNSALPVKLKNHDAKKEMYTTATALNCGWLFELPTKHKIGRGYVYSDQFIDEEGAIKELEQHFNTQVEPVKHIKFDSGRLENAWVKNCIAIGLSAAFLEPLQATGLHCTLVQIEDFLVNCLCDTVTETCNSSTVKQYNTRTSALYQQMADFVSLHYTGGRTDTEFWKHVTHDCERTDAVNEIVRLSQTRLTRLGDLPIHMGHAGIQLWNYSLHGLGYFNKDKIRNLFKAIDFDGKRMLQLIEQHRRHITLETQHCLTLDTLDQLRHNE